MTSHTRDAEAQRAPTRPGKGEFTGPLNYAYHFEAARLAEILSAQASAMGVAHLGGTLTGVGLNAETGAIDHVVTAEHGTLIADLYIDCSGFRAELIGGALQSRSEEHTSELQSLMRISYDVFCLKKKKSNRTN